ncbi:MAG: phosphoribosyl transferase [Desulfurococcales archaeon ex4484_42]|nr:MAG: phosphoribosyl transferase [Desulfurococcales archaeon ex4484_42]
MGRVPTKLVSWDDIVKWSRELAKKIKESGFKPDVVVAVARGGFIPARLICDFLGVENLLSLQSQHWTEAAKAAERAIIKFPYKVDLTGKKVLLVDDIVDTGESLALAKKYILENWRPKELRIATLQWIKPVAKIKPDYYLIEVTEWVWFQYPWTRLEDTYQFFKRMLSEEGKHKKIWTKKELIDKFIEWYEIDVGIEYFNDAIEMLIENGILKKRDDKYIYKG